MSPVAASAAHHPTPNDGNAALWLRARALLPTAQAGGLVSALADRHFCVLAEDPGSPDARLFAEAAAALGARVTHLSPERAGLSDGAPSGGTGHLLARLYDAIECQGLTADRVHGLAAATSIPVFASLAATARGFGGDALPLLQACLVASLR
jgi:ornithine carbamoyltransferase